VIEDVQADGFVEGSCSANPEQPVSAATSRPSETEPMLYCPVCSRCLEESKCKLICPQCGYYMSCSDYY
jgi:hypothetical protein